MHDRRNRAVGSSDNRGGALGRLDLTSDEGGGSDLSRGE